MTSAQFKRWLAQRGCQFRPARGGHLKVIWGDRWSYLPVHGSNKELGAGLVETIKKQLGLKGRKE